MTASKLRGTGGLPRFKEILFAEFGGEAVFLAEVQEGRDDFLLGDRVGEAIAAGMPGGFVGGGICMVNGFD